MVGWSDDKQETTETPNTAWDVLWLFLFIYFYPLQLQFTTTVTAAHKITRSNMHWPIY